MAGSIDLLVADVERIGVLVAELMGREKMETSEKISIIKSIYEDGYNINSNEVNLNNKIVQEILQLADNEPSNIRKVNNLINTIEFDMSLTEHDHLKSEVLKSLLGKIIELDSKNYLIARIQKLKELNHL
jgi:hypothetical protein